MKKNISLLLTFCATLIIPSLFVFADEKPSEETKKIYNASEEDILKFIKACPNIKKAFGMNTTDEQKLLTSMKTHPAVEIAKIAKTYGFKNEEELRNVFETVIAGFALLRLKEIEAKLDESIASFPPALAATMKPQLDKIKKDLCKYDDKVSPETIELIKKHCPELEKLFPMQK
jgi:hypothetical protein